MPISNNFTFPKTEKRVFELLPAGTYLIECSDIEAQMSDYDKTKPPKPVLNFTFTVQDEKYKGQKLWRNAPAYQFSKVLIEIVSALDKPIEEVDPSSLSGLIGKRCLALVGKKPKQKGGEKNAIFNFLPLSQVGQGLKEASSDTDEIRTEDIPF